MMKTKNYFAPETEVMMLQQTTCLCASGAGADVEGPGMHGGSNDPTDDDDAAPRRFF